MGFLQQVAAGSFIAGFFINDYDDEHVKHSFFGSFMDKLFNKPPKIIKPPDIWPKFFSNLISGSRLLNTVCQAMETPVPFYKNLKDETRFFNPSAFVPILQWILYALPAWGLLAIFALSPFLPTMVLAGMLSIVFAVALFRQKFIIEPVSVSVFLFVLITLFSGVTSFHPASSIPIALLTAAIMSVYFLALVCFDSRKRIDIALFFFTASAVVTGIYGIYRAVTGHENRTWIDQELFEDLPLKDILHFRQPQCIRNLFITCAAPRRGIGVVRKALVLETVRRRGDFSTCCGVGVDILPGMLSGGCGCGVAVRGLDGKTLDCIPCRRSVGRAVCVADYFACKNVGAFGQYY
jgi:hypothetical protein